MNVILDIDETFVQFVGTDDWAALPAAERAKYEIGGQGRTGLFILRPHFNEFFEYLRDNCKTINLWTWSDDDYANAVKELIESRVAGAEVANVWYDEHVDKSIALSGHNKDLNYIWYNDPNSKNIFKPCDTILVDDLPPNTQNRSNIKNGIQLAPFHPLGEKLSKEERTRTKIRTGEYTDMSKDDVLMKVAAVIQAAIDNPAFCEDGDLPAPFEGSTKVGGRRRRKTRRCKKNKCKSIRRKTISR
jgi:hypothetical protein